MDLNRTSMNWYNSHRNNCHNCMGYEISLIELNKHNHNNRHYYNHPSGLNCYQLYIADPHCNILYQDFHLLQQMQLDPVATAKEHLWYRS